MKELITNEAAVWLAITILALCISILAKEIKIIRNYLHKKY